ncbi:MAG: HAD hydrolase family protein [Bacteroidales bacterium]|nr:HAD hydrolase family protein [Bacteroidales bacterium]
MATRNYRSKLRNISTFIFDFDGVMTNGNIYLATNGLIIRQGNVKDGYAIQLAIKKGYQVVVISGSNDENIRLRCAFFKIPHVYTGIENKEAFLRNFMKEQNLHSENLLYMGDDIPDYHAMLLAGVRACPKDAAHEIKSISDYISPHMGGEGCVRDVIEQVLKVKGDWFDEDAFCW